MDLAFGSDKRTPHFCTSSLTSLGEVDTPSLCWKFLTTLVLGLLAAFPVPLTLQQEEISSLK